MKHRSQLTRYEKFSWWISRNSVTTIDVVPEDCTFTALFEIKVLMNSDLMSVYVPNSYTKIDLIRNMLLTDTKDIVFSYIDGGTIRFWFKKPELAMEFKLVNS